MEVNRNEYRRTKRLYEQGRVNAFILSAERNPYDYTISWRKRVCCVVFLKRCDWILADYERCWTALKYTKPWASSTTQALGDRKGNTATSLEDKTKMVRRTAFPPTPADPMCPPLRLKGRAHQSVDEVRVRKALFNKSQKKAPGWDTLSFSTLQLMWEWDAGCIAALIHYSN